MTSVQIHRRNNPSANDGQDNGDQCDERAEDHVVQMPALHRVLRRRQAPRDLRPRLLQVAPDEGDALLEHALVLLEFNVNMRMEATVTEAEWVKMMAGHCRSVLRDSEHFKVEAELPLAYGYEITGYLDRRPIAKAIKYKTDLAIVEITSEGERPRVVIEAKLGSVSTHSAITYSQKAASHRAVHPYLRYGVMLGHRRNFPLPGRLYRHGAQFDFMISFRGYEPSDTEMKAFADVLRAEIEASRTLQSILYESRKPGRDRYTVLHRRLEVR